MAVASVRSIDGIPIPLPIHEKHIEGMVARFSREDLRAVVAAADRQPSEENAPELDLVELTPLETLRIWAVIGELETIAGWVAPAFIAAAVRQISGERILLPSSKEEIKALVARLGPAGMSKASSFMLARSAAERQAEADKQAAAKN